MSKSCGRAIQRLPAARSAVFETELTVGMQETASRVIVVSDARALKVEEILHRGSRGHRNMRILHTTASGIPCVGPEKQNVKGSLVFGGPTYPALTLGYRQGPHNLGTSRITNVMVPPHIAIASDTSNLPRDDVENCLVISVSSGVFSLPGFWLKASLQPQHKINAVSESAFQAPSPGAHEI